MRVPTIRLITLLALGLLGGCLSACKRQRQVDYARIKSLQDYTVPIDTLPFGTDTNRRALFIFPHPDDEVSHAGTIACLKRMGAQVKLVTLTKGAVADSATRAAEWRCAVQALGIDSARLYSFYNNTWDQVSHDRITYWPEHRADIEAVLAHEIASFRPSALYLYDTLIGGYGHHEHIITSQAALAACRRLRQRSSLTVKRVYFSTLPEKLDTFLLGDVPTYALFRQKNHGRGKPQPTVAYAIASVWDAKKRAALCHASQAQAMRKFFLVPEGADSLHYATFDREYYSAFTW